MKAHRGQWQRGRFPSPRRVSRCREDQKRKGESVLEALAAAGQGGANASDRIGPCRRLVDSPLEHEGPNGRGTTQARAML